MVGLYINVNLYDNLRHIYPDEYTFQINKNKQHYITVSTAVLIVSTEQ